MKKLNIYLLLILISSSVYSQSKIVYDAGTSIDISDSAEVCADTIAVNGTFSGSGTFCNSTVGVKLDSHLIPGQFALHQNYPNPFNPSTKIEYDLPNSGNVKLEVYNSIGQIISTLVNGFKEAGYQVTEFNGINLSSGIYFYKIQVGSFVETRKMILVK